MKFVPKPGILVTYPGPEGDSREVPPEGVQVGEPLKFWARRVADGDGELIEDVVQTAAAPSKKTDK